MTLSKIIIGDRGRLAQLLPGQGNNQQARASDVNTVIDAVNALESNAVVTPTASPAAVVDSSGGTPGSAPFTLAAITQVANTGSADVAPVADAISKLAAEIALIKTALIASGVLV